MYAWECVCRLFCYGMNNIYFVRLFTFSFFSMLGMKDKLITDLGRRIFMAEVEVIKAVEGPILRKRDYEQIYTHA